MEHEWRSSPRFLYVIIPCGPQQSQSQSHSGTVVVVVVVEVVVLVVVLVDVVVVVVVVLDVVELMVVVLVLVVVDVLLVVVLVLVVVDDVLLVVVLTEWIWTLPAIKVEGPVRVARRRNAEFVRRPGLAAVIDVDGEGLADRTGRADDGGHAGERGVRHRAAGARGDVQRAIRLDLDPHVHRMVVVVQVPCLRRARQDHEAEAGLGVRVDHDRNQSRRGEEVPGVAPGGEDRATLNLATTGHLVRAGAAGMDPPAPVAGSSAGLVGGHARRG